MPGNNTDIILIRIIDEETLKKIDIEFILKQETKRTDYIKDEIFPS